MYKIGDRIRWTGGTKTAGPGRSNIAIKNGDIRTILQLSADGLTAVLTRGEGLPGCYGWTQTANFEKVVDNPET